MENQSKEIFLPRKVFLEKTKILDMRYFVALYLTGGVSFDLINEKGYDTDFNQKNAK